MGSRVDGPSPSRLDTVELIPWDPTSEPQAKRLYEQRVACTWDYDQLEYWKTRVMEGTKFFYWIKIRDDFPGWEELLATHVENWPKEYEPIIDTATTLANAPRTPTNLSFIPIGHIALDLFPERNTKYSLPSTTVWIKSFYISWSLQAGGFGRASMNEAERLAVLPPLNATTIALDTATKEFQQREETVRTFAQARGEVAAQKAVEDAKAGRYRTTQDWYVRQGYEIIAREENVYDWTDPLTGQVIHVPGVFLKKSLV